MLRLSSPICLLSTVFFTLLNRSECEVRVRLYEEWQDPVQHISDAGQLFDLIPRRPRNYDEKQASVAGGKGTEKTILMLIYEESCQEGLSNPLYNGALYQTGPGTVQVAALKKSVYPSIETEWGLSYNCSHFLFIPVFSYFDDYVKFSVLNDQSLPRYARWINENSRIVTPFINACPYDIDFYWYDKDKHFLGTLKPGQRREEHTFLGHAFLATKHGTDQIVDAYLIENSNPISIQERAHWCEDSGFNTEEECQKGLERDIVGWTYDFWAQKREALNYVQPKILSNFTRMGFKKSRLPDDIYGRILGWWSTHNSSDQMLTEHYAGPVMNQYTSPTYMAHLPQAERKLLIDYLRNVLSEWAGIDPNQMEMTSLYGIRKYTRNAILGMHVDTCRTHVISAILNVDSVLTPNGRDWPLQIYDHQDNLHSFTMKPGDLVYYESAKCGHARFEPLDGEWYANAFIHFAPKRKEDWDCSWF